MRQKVAKAMIESVSTIARCVISFSCIIIGFNFDRIERVLGITLLIFAVFFKFNLLVFHKNGKKRPLVIDYYASICLFAVYVSLVVYDSLFIFFTLLEVLYGLFLKKFKIADIQREQETRTAQRDG